MRKGGFVLDFLHAFYVAFFLENTSLSIMFFSFFAVLVLTSFICYHLSSGGLFLSVAAVLLGVSAIVVKGQGVDLSSVVPYYSLLFIMVGVAYLMVFTLVKMRQKRARMRAKREYKAREMRYELPQKDNTFVRARLGNFTKEVKREVQDVVGDIQLRFTYAKNLLEKLRLQSLGATERLEMDELASVFALYSKKDGFVGEDIRLVNDAFSRVLKLAAKYAV